MTLDVSLAFPNASSPYTYHLVLSVIKNLCIARQNACLAFHDFQRLCETVNFDYNIGYLGLANCSYVEQLSGNIYTLNKFSFLNRYIES